MAANEVKHDKRKNAYWDSIYTGCSLKLTDHNWDFKNNIGPTRLLFKPDPLLEFLNKKTSKRYPVHGITFTSCDFFGDFSDIEISFVGCKFIGCDFGGTIWRDAKFSGCTIDACSLTIAEFYSCQFYNCSWNKITVSGTETKFSDTLVTNPREFVGAMYTNTDANVLSAFTKSVPYQLMRLENTKAKIARSIYINSEGYGDEKAYYEGLRGYVTQSLMAMIRESIYNFRAKKNRLKNLSKIFGGYIEYGILNISGFINAWGRSIVRPSIIGLLTMAAFGAYYGFDQHDYAKGFVQGFDITFLVGYTKYATRDLAFEVQALYAMNAFFGLWWYAILVPTVINRLSRKS